jgi:hypothetical protein
MHQVSTNPINAITSTHNRLSHNTLLRISSLLHRHLDALVLRGSHCAGEIIKPRMLQRIMGTDPQLGAELQHSLQQIDTTGINLREDLTEDLG